ncbi:galactocerebrosidase-like [Tubulanus polymorphus]|uniref:galactocerebrosidase-like n=1 Tax=Tubulanus polymorphus TaxID=672921 RepID=UPI003DA404FF
MKLLILMNILISSVMSAGVYDVDDTPGLGLEFDGVGGISAGATSPLLVNYPEPYRSHILDYLFKPNFGASLHILKVEIGGDSQSTDGTEASHMHTSDDENYFRGYEWWLMKEAKFRNPNIRLYGLPWAFPVWLGSQGNPYKNRTNLVTYIMNWITGAQKYHNLTIDYIGIWNERPFDTEYIKMLREALDQSGYETLRIVAADGVWEPIISDVLDDPVLSKAIDAIGVHYPGTHSPDNALKTDKKLWGSEEYSAYDDLHGGACWARILTESYVNGHLTGILSWSVIASYYDALPYTRNGLMTANTPWSGYYDVSSPIWISAHITQFTEIGWRYLKHDFGVGRLVNNGTYTALTSPDQKALTIIISTIDPAFGHCFYAMPKFSVAPEKALFRLKGTYRYFTKLYVWYSKFDTIGNSTILFKRMKTIPVINGIFELNLAVNEVYTLTTLSTGNKGYYPIPRQKPFPVSYTDNFETGYEAISEPKYFAQQAGVFEVVKLPGDSHNQVVKQTVTAMPINWCKVNNPITLIGNYSWSDLYMQVDILTSDGENGTSGMFIAARINKGGCHVHRADGIYLFLDYKTKLYSLTGSTFKNSTVYLKDKLELDYGVWYTVSMDINTIPSEHGIVTNVNVQLNKKRLFNYNISSPTSSKGFMAVGMIDFGVGYFDNFHFKSNEPRSTVQFKDEKLYFEREVA